MAARHPPGIIYPVSVILLIMKIISTNPAKNYQIIDEIELTSNQDITTKTAAAQAAKNEWKLLGINKRIELLRPIQKELLERKQEIAELITTEVGKPISQSLSEVERYADGELGWFLDNAATALADETTMENNDTIHKIRYEPRGVVAAIAPWNYPFGMAIWGIFPNLVAGNTVIFKASEECPLVGKLIGDIIDSHNLPNGVFSQIFGAGEAGKTLTDGDIDLIWFTGSTETGKALYKKAASKFIGVVLEMGGSNPCVVFDDVDISSSAPIMLDGRMQNCGQICSSLKRLIVQETIFDETINELARLLGEKTIGDPSDENTDIGSLVAKRQQELLQDQLNDALNKGAIIVAQKEVPEHLSGAFFPPTILKNITPNMRVWHEEVFGPIYPVVSFSDEAEAIRLANDTVYGLGGRVMSKDKNRALRVAGQIDAGTISLNTESTFAPCDPFGGYKSSGMGRERGIHGLRELCQIKVIQEDK
jgi:acyl-CoA reductase-like NAD-dependent aldehyde dehydrogenase